MPAEVVESWLITGGFVIVYRISLRPVEHKLMKGKPLSSRKGQAEAFFLIDSSGNWWILKKFNSGCSLDPSYLSKVGTVLPRHPAFACGTDRYVLSQGAVQRVPGCYYSPELDNWLDGTVLMPRILGTDWAAVADDIREGSLQLDQAARLHLCANLSQLIQLLENGRCAHRDLSCGNVFIDTTTWEVSLIDFDSLYHPSLVMPQATTCGTPGYMSHLVQSNGKIDARRSWCDHADRYALALVNAELLLMNPGVKLTGEGGLFEQDELTKQSGPGIDSIVTELRSRYPRAADMLVATIHSSSLSDCPSPSDWISFCNNMMGSPFTPPRLADLPEFSPQDSLDRLTRSREAAPPWPAPSLRDVPDPVLRLPMRF